VAKVRCPPWCEQHLFEYDDSNVLTAHMSAMMEVVGLCAPHLAQEIRDGVTEPRTLNVEPGGWAYLEPQAEAQEYVERFNQVMAKLTAKASSEVPAR
jgi:hypothetical protein